MIFRVALIGLALLLGACHDGSGTQLYLGQMDAKDPRVSPLYEDLTVLPPVLLHVGEDEVLLDDARRYAVLLANSGAVSELHVWQGMVHVFPANLATLLRVRTILLTRL
jgi:acetyl esterase/lipase